MHDGMKRWRGQLLGGGFAAPAGCGGGKMGVSTSRRRAMVDFDKGGVTAASEFEEAYDDRREIRGAILSEPLGRVPRRELVTVAASATTGEVIRMMNDRHTGCAVVVQGERL